MVIAALAWWKHTPDFYWRSFFFIVLGFLLLEPVVVNEVRQPLPDKLVIVVDESPSENIAARNETAEKINIPKAQVLTNERKTKLTARLKDCGGIDGWKTALSILEKSSHCKGKNNRGWKANFDFMLTKSSFVKLMEGNYDSHVPAPAAKHDPSLELAQKMGILP